MMIVLQVELGMKDLFPHDKEQNGFRREREREMILIQNRNNRRSNRTVHLNEFEVSEREKFSFM